MPPPGGPDDVEPPQVEQAFPSSGTLNFPVDQSVTLTFSEWIQPRTARRAISVYPTLEEGYDIDVSGRRLRIQPSASFAESTTYHIEVGAGLSDYQNVQVTSPIHIFFSTGPALDSGKISGCILGAADFRTQPHIGLYRYRQGASVDSVLLSTPAYLVQTDSTGFFSLDHIRTGPYLTIAFTDQDRNARLGPGREQTYAPTDLAITIDSSTGPIRYYPVAADTMSPQIVALRPLSPTLLLARWSGTAAADIDTAWSILAGEGEKARQAPSIESWSLLCDSLQWLLSLSDSLQPGSYHLRYPVTHRLELPNDTTGAVFDTVRFEGRVSPDTLPPASSQVAQQGTPLRPSVQMVWTEPVVFADSLVPVIDTTGDTTFFSLSQTACDTTEALAPHSLAAGMRYTLRLAASSVQDLWGTTAIDTADSPAVSYSFSTIAPKSIAHSLSGSATCPPEGENIIWEYRPVRGNWTLTAADSAGTFRFDTLAAGKGVIGYFDDRNGDGQPSPGSLFPWQPPEPHIVLSDTVEARANWDVEGVEVNTCEVCRGKAKARKEAGQAER
jgi:hypothetical protein